MAYHNETCGCAECGYYGQRYNPRAIHNQSCGCAECGNYAASAPAASPAKQPISSDVLVAVPKELLAMVNALIQEHHSSSSDR